MYHKVVLKYYQKTFWWKVCKLSFKSLKKTVIELRGELAALRQTTDNLSRDLAESKANEIEAQTEAARCKDKLDKLRTSHETVRKQARAEIETVREQLSSLQCMNEKTLQDLAACEMGTVAALSNIDTLQQSNNKLSQDLEHAKSQQVAD
jgi:chromosome segregation ATPase